MVKQPLRSGILLGLVLLTAVVYAGALGQQSWRLSENAAGKRQAVQLAIDAQQVIGSRLTGEEYTPLTTTLGAVAAKKLSLHPDFAAVAVELLQTAGVRSGDAVAVNMSGSFPALNIAVLAAIQSLGAQPVITSSVGASTWGANRPEYTWLDMERDLQDAGIWPWRTRAAGLGGVGDSGGGLSEEGVAMAQAAITRTGTPAIAAVNLAEAVQLRLTAYRQPNGQLPAALVNVGGSHVVFGDQGHRIVLRPGLLSGYQAAAPLRDGLAAAFLDANRPVIHLLNIVRLAAEYGIDPESAPGSSRVFYTRSLSLTVQAFISGWLAAILVVLWYGRRRRWWQGPCR